MYKESEYHTLQINHLRIFALWLPHVCKISDLIDISLEVVTNIITDTYLNIHKWYKYCKSKLIYQLSTINTKPQSIKLYSKSNASTPVLMGWTPGHWHMIAWI